MKNKQLPQNALTGAIITSMFLWGMGWPSAKVLTKYCSVINAAGYRYMLVIVSLLVVLTISGTSLKVARKGIPAVIAAGVLLSFYSFFFLMGVHVGAAGAGGVLVTTLNPIVAYTLGLALSRKLPSRNEAIGLALGLLAGSVLLQLWTNPHMLFDSGNLYFLACAVTWAVMSKFTAAGSKYGTSGSFSFWQYVVTLVCLLPMMHFDEMSTVFTIKEPAFWGNLVFGATIVTAVATTVYFYATTKLGAERASSFIFLVPLAAALSSWVYINEPIKLHTVIGGTIGMAAVYMINRKKKTA